MLGKHNSLWFLLEAEGAGGKGEAVHFEIREDGVLNIMQSPRILSPPQLTALPFLVFPRPASAWSRSLASHSGWVGEKHFVAAVVQAFETRNT